ncbi:phosphoesterase [Candidatus Woesearchaeota archaeon]|nr:metallophosphoesterase [Candidatus Woesearchaeota archaeon]RLE43022.1 MAG: phosphoesterase [Candidatus Woesearchaeota archaeon]
MAGLSEIGIGEGLYIVDLGLVLKEEQCLVLADFHIGYEEALNKQGVLVPRFSFQDILSRLKPLLKQSYNTIIINGDLKHEFGEISNQEWQETQQILDLLKSKTKHLVLIKGNHDTILEPIARRKDVSIRDYIMFQGVYITHGHKLPSDVDFHRANTVIIAHEHPAVSIRDGLRSELFKCFLVGRYEQKKLVVMPSFNPITPGSDVRKQKLLSPFLTHGINEFEVYVVEDKVYYFGRLKDLE